MGWINTGISYSLSITVYTCIFAITASAQDLSKRDPCEHLTHHANTACITDTNRCCSSPTPFISTMAHSQLPSSLLPTSVGQQLSVKKRYNKTSTTHALSDSSSLGHAKFSDFTSVRVPYPILGELIFTVDNQGYIQASAHTGELLWRVIPKQLLDQTINTKAQSSPLEQHNKLIPKRLYWSEQGKKYIASGVFLRRYSYYALDVTNPKSPQLQWYISPDVEGYSELGQLWASPIKTQIKIGAKKHSVLVFGGGYDSRSDVLTTPIPDSIGDGIYVIDALSGKIISKKTDLGYSIPSAVTAIDINGDQAVDQLYVGDMGGRVLRIELDEQGSLFTKVIANLAGKSLPHQRRFYHAPDLSLLPMSNQLAIAIGSGYRAKPNKLDSQDRFYLIKQPLLPLSKPAIITEEDLLVANLPINSSLLPQHGWYFPLKTGEKILASSLTFHGDVYFTSYQPPLSDHNSLNQHSIARLYRINMTNGASRNSHHEATLQQGTLTANNCNNNACNQPQPYQRLNLSSIPPAPRLVKLGTHPLAIKYICVERHCQKMASAKIKIKFWLEAP